MPFHPPIQVHPSDLHTEGLLAAPEIPSLLSQHAQMVLHRWIAQQAPESLPNTQLTSADLVELDWPVIFDNRGRYYVMYSITNDSMQHLLLKTEKEKADFLKRRGCHAFQDLSAQNRSLGRGAFGEVQLCQREDGLWMACKSLSVVDYDEEKAAVARIKNEYEIGVQLDPNTAISEKEEKENYGAGWIQEKAVQDLGIDSVYEEKTLKINLFITLLEGVTLKRFFKQEQDKDPTEKESPLTEMQALKIVIAVLEKLALLHQRNILHRDLKPENIMLFPDGSVEIFDYGLSIQVSDTQTAPAEEFAGTIEYSAPELFPSEHQRYSQYSEKSDVFAVGRLALDLLHEGVSAIRDDPFQSSFTEPTDGKKRSLLNYRNERLQSKIQHFFEQKDLMVADSQVLAFFLTLLSPRLETRPSVQEALRRARLLLPIHEDRLVDSGAHFTLTPSPSPISIRDLCSRPESAQSAHESVTPPPSPASPRAQQKPMRKKGGTGGG